MKTPSQRVCVLTEFRATLYYVAAEIEGLGLGCRLLHGEMRAEERAQSLMSFLNTGTVLMATTAVMSAGVDLSEVTDLILYDLPHSKTTLQQVLGRFDRFGRLHQLNIHVLIPTNGYQGLFTSESLSYLHNILGSPGSGTAKG